MSDSGSNEAATDEVPASAFFRRDLVAAGILFLFALIVYVRTLAPDVLFGDSGEFQVLAGTGGLAHTTGYPIYLLIAKLFSWLPIASIAYRVNLQSAVMGAIAVSELYLLGRSLGVRALYAVAGAIFLMVNPIFWWQAVIAEVYTTSTAFFLAFMLCAAVWRNQREPRWLAAGGLLGGLCLGLHFTTLLVLPAIVIYLFLSKARKQDWSMAGAGAAAGLGIALAMYIVGASVDAHANFINCIKPSASAYGMKPEDFDNPVKAVEFLVTARQFRDDIATFNADQSIKNTGNYASEALSDFGWAGLAFAALGAPYLLFRRGRRAQGALFAMSWLILFIWVLKYNAFDIEVFFLLSFSLLCLFVGMGLQGFEDIVAKRNAKYGQYAGIAGLVLAAAFIAPVLSGVANTISEGQLTFLDKDEADYPYRIARPHDAHLAATGIVNALGPNALFLVTWTMQYPVYYVANFEANRPDIEVDEWDPYGARMSQSMIDYVDQCYQTRPVYVFAPLAQLEDKYDFVPVRGAVQIYLLHRKGT